MKKPQFSEAFPEAVVRKGADGLTFRDEEVGSLRTFIDTKHVQLERWRPPLVDVVLLTSSTKSLHRLNWPPSKRNETQTKNQCCSDKRSANPNLSIQEHLPTGL